MERAKFEMKGEKYDPKLKPRKLRKKEMEALKKKHDKMFEWVPDKLRGQRAKREKASCCCCYCFCTACLSDIDIQSFPSHRL